MAGRIKCSLALVFVTKILLVYDTSKPQYLDNAPEQRSQQRMIFITVFLMFPLKDGSDGARKVVRKVRKVASFSLP